jgi:hypothetical protein
LKPKQNFSTFKNALAYYNAGVVAVGKLRSSRIGSMSSLALLSARYLHMFASCISNYSLSYAKSKGASLKDVFAHPSANYFIL